MRNIFWLTILALFACTTESGESSPEKTDFQWEIDRFADIRILRYQVPGFDKLSLDQKKLVYYLTQAGLSGRDIMYDMNYRHNLSIRKTLDNIVENFKGKREGTDWDNFMIYTKKVWFASGIHHHYSMDKFEPGFSKEYFQGILTEMGTTALPDEVFEAIFNSDFDNKKVNLDAEKGLLLGSAVNFYDPDITQAEAEAFYAAKSADDGVEPVSHGLNSRLVRNSDGSVGEEVYKVDGLFGPAIKEIISWLEKAVTVAENDPQKHGLELLIEYYKTGSLDTWDEYNVVWTEATAGDIDYINSFIEVYNDPLGYKGSYESIVEINDFVASERMKVLSENVQWFEDNSPILDEHKKENVVGVSYKVVNVAGESGDASPSTPVGVNLPNSNWIRAKHGSKSVSLGNIINAYDKASGPGMLKEFAHDDEEISLGIKHGELADKMSTALHEVIGHASGKIEDGIGTPNQTLKSYASALEEARADIVALYYILDPKLVELGLMPSVDAGKAEYDGYISNGMLKQLRRVELGKAIEPSHLRNRALIAHWAFEMGREDNVIAEVKKDGKTYYDIRDYQKLKNIFGEQLIELQRIKSQGDFEAGKNLIETYGVKIDQDIHKEVLKRVEKLNIAAYSGFVNPELVPVTDDAGNIMDIKIEYPDNFTMQMLSYSKRYSFL